MARLKVVGYDPSLRNWGIAAGILDTDTGKLTIKSLRVICGVVPDGKQVRQNSKDLAVSEQLYDGALPFSKGANLIFAEVPVGSQSARGMTSYGVCVGVLGALRHTSPIFEVTPDEVKRVTGMRNATKDQMIEWAVKNHPEAPWPLKKSGEIIKGTAEHMADAVVAIHAGLASAQYKQFAAMQNHGVTP